MSSVKPFSGLQRTGVTREVADISSGEDTAWLQAAFLEHGNFVRRLASRLLGPAGDPDDVVQEVFLVAWRRRSLFEEAVPRPWLFGVTLRVCSSLRRRSKWRRFLRLEEIQDCPSGDDTEAGLERTEASRIVYEVLERLSEKKRVVFILFEIEGWTGEEIARTLDCPVKTVWTRLHHARREFQHHLLHRRAEEEEA